MPRELCARVPVVTAERWFLRFRDEAGPGIRSPTDAA